MPARDGFRLSLWRRRIHHPAAYDNKRGGGRTAERIRTEFKKETFSPASGQEVHVTVSTGLTQYKPQEEMKVFVHRVDQLMYQGKKSGKDRVCSESSPQE